MELFDRSTDAAERIDGSVLRVVHHNPSTRYTVLRVQMAGEAAPVTWVGRSSGIEEGMQVSAAGEWTHHPTYGKQFGFARIAAKAPTTLPGIQRRLEKYPGVGPDKAEKIINRFGLDTLKIIDSQPRRLLEVEGIGPKTLERIVAHHAERNGPVAEVENQLLELELPTHFADAIVQRFGDASLTTVRQHPYRLAREVRGIGFITADKIARALGVDLESDERIEAGVLHALEQSELDGHCALPLPALVQASERLLELAPSRIEAIAVGLVRTGALVLDERERDDGSPLPPLCYPPRFFTAEHNVADVLVDIALGSGQGRPRWTAVDPPAGLSAGQLAAIAAIRDAGLVVLTGGPGTGKSTVTRAIIDTALANEAEVLLAAPTGRAAKRLAEATGQRATTIHRLLEIQGGTGEFFYNAQNPLPPALVVIDEASMLDLPLAEALLLALTPQHRLLLVGDADQLPSVGPGNVLRDIIAAADRPDSPIPVVRLTQIFRQAEGSSIVTSAHAILHGKVPQTDRAEGGQFYVVPARDGERAHELVLKAVLERIPKAYGLDPRGEIQVLCPMHRGRAGTEALNAALQEHHTKGAPELQVPGRGLRIFRVGDRVMQTKNDHDRGVFNGDIGVVTSVDPEKQTLVVEVDGDPVPYDNKQLGALQLAYAVSIHKSQGSEFPAIVVPILGEHHVMLRRNLLYTAVTRARKLCVVVGDPRAIAQAVHRSDAARRFTGLRERLLARLRERLGERRVVRIGDD
jgi:exodeoxyribonuclease V alpha subunit